MKLVKKLSGSVGEIVDKVEKGMKWVAAAAIAVGASVATGGAAAPAAAARLAGMAAKGGTMAKVAKGGLSLMSAGKEATKVFRQPGLIGDLSRDALKGSLGGIKKSTGLDLKAASDGVNNYQKNFTKFAGAEANRIGSTEEQEMEKKHREETVAGIDSHAEEMLGENTEEKNLTEALKEAAVQTAKLDEDIDKKDKEIENKKKEIEAAPSRETKSALYAEQQKLESDKKELQAKKAGATNTETISKQALDEHKKDRDERKKALVKQIAAERGYSMEEHEKRMGKINAEGKFEAGEIEAEIKAKKTAQGAYLDGLKGYAGKKAARAVRESIKKGGKYEERSTEQKWLDEVREKIEKSEKEKKGANNGGEDKKEKKEEVKK
jgi:hypothetical protein